MGRPLKIAKAQAVLTITATNATTEEVTVSQTLANEGIIAGMPFIPATTTGGLVGGTTYWVLKVTGASTFTVSATDLSANPTSTPANLTATTGTTVSATVGLVDSYFNNPNGSANTYSVVGGNTALYGKQVLVGCAISEAGVGTITASTTSANLVGVGTDFANTLADGDVVATTDGTVLGVIDDIANANATFATFAANSAGIVSAANYVYATPETGYIIRQKGKTKYLVKGLTTGLIGACFTANVATANLAPNKMNIVATDAAAANAFVQSLSDHTVELFGGDNTLPNSSPAYATFNTAYAANTYGGQPYPIVTITNA